MNAPSSTGNMEQASLAIKILKCAEDSPLRSHSTPLLVSAGAPWIFGRSSSANVRLDDRSVSREHARVEVDEEAGSWFIENLSRNNGVFIDKLDVPPGGSQQIPNTTARLQLGKVLLEIEWLQATRPHTSLLEDLEDPFLQVSRDGDCCTVHCKGKLLSLKPSSALALYALSANPGEVVHTWDIQEVMGERYDLPQAISGIRRALRELLDQGWITREELIQYILETRATADDLLDTSDAELVRKLVFARRGHGYALAIPRARITTEDAG